jgi:DNA-binding NtrC family response regulator
MLSLVIRYETHVIHWPLPVAEAQLGSAGDNDIVAPFPGVSRTHASVAYVNGRLVIRDAGSRNGVLHAGKRVSEASVSPGEMVRIGRAWLSLEDARTSDVEMTAVTTKRQREEERETGGGALERQPSAAGALRLARELEQGGTSFAGRRRDQVVHALCDATAADAVALFHISPNGGATIYNISGRLVAEDELIAAARAVPKSRRLVTGRTTTVYWQAFVSGLNSDRLALFFPATAQVPEWIPELLGFVAQKLLRADKADEPRANPIEDGSLNLPAGMVVGPSEAMQRLMGQIAATVGSRLNVLLLGETGTGKELFARMIHESGPTSGGPFIAVNCAAIPSDLLEAELFGVHARVATGVDPRPGLFAQAHRGSILLDEISEMPQVLQAKLLRVLQEREVLPLGAPRPRKVEVRVISASNSDLPELVRQGGFRSDLYYRLRGLQYHVPPLRDRRDDIAHLALEFVRRAADEYGKQIRGVTRAALRMLTEHQWPGNVRELQNEVQRAVLVCPTGTALQADHFGTVRWEVRSGARVDAPSPPDAADALRTTVEDAERAAVLAALEQARWNQSAAARILGISRNGLRMKMARLHIDRR